MSPLLAFAIVLLIVVAGLALWQRRSREQTSGPGARLASAGVAAAAPEDTPSAPAPISDPVLGTITYAGHGFWTRDDLEFAGATMQLEIFASEAGPPPEVGEYLQAALAPETALDARARAAIHADARERGLTEPDDGPALHPNQVAIGIDGDRVFRGYVWYTSEDPDGEFGVSSTDMWRTLTVEFID
jgi:hypothetical protein